MRGKFRGNGTNRLRITRSQDLAWGIRQVREKQGWREVAVHVPLGVTHALVVCFVRFVVPLARRLRARSIEKRSGERPFGFRLPCRSERRTW